MAKLFKIEFDGFVGGQGHEGYYGYRANDYLPGYNVVRFAAHVDAQAYVDHNHRGLDTEGVDAKFRVVESDEEIPFDADSRICAGAGDDYDKGRISSAMDPCHGYSVPCLLIEWSSCRTWTAVEDLREVNES